MFKLLLGKHLSKLFDKIVKSKYCKDIVTPHNLAFYMTFEIDKQKINETNATK